MHKKVASKQPPVDFSSSVIYKTQKKKTHWVLHCATCKQSEGVQSFQQCTHMRRYVCVYLSFAFLWKDIGCCTNRLKAFQFVTGADLDAWRQIRLKHLYDLLGWALGSSVLLYWGWVVEQRFMHFCLSFYLCLAFAKRTLDHKICNHWWEKGETGRRGCSGGWVERGGGDSAI